VWKFSVFHIVFVIFGARAAEKVKGHPYKGASIPSRAKTFVSSPNCSEYLWRPPSLFSMGNRGSSLWGEAAGAWS